MPAGQLSYRALHAYAAARATLNTGTAEPGLGFPNTLHMRILIPLNDERFAAVLTGHIDYERSSWILLLLISNRRRPCTRSLGRQRERISSCSAALIRNNRWHSLTAVFACDSSMARISQPLSSGLRRTASTQPLADASLKDTDNEEDSIGSAHVGELAPLLVFLACEHPGRTRFNIGSQHITSGRWRYQPECSRR